MVVYVGGKKCIVKIGQETTTTEIEGEQLKKIPGQSKMVKKTIFKIPGV